MKTAVVLSLGGNKGDREQLLNQAIAEIKIHFEVVSISGIYRTSAWGGVAKGEFLNQVAVIRTDKNPEQTLQIIQDIEAKLGRRRDEHWGDRTMDIDILYFGDCVMDTEQLKIPHPFMAQRKFVLIPLAELLPKKVHPVSGLNTLQMLENCDDLSEVSLLEKQNGL
jgi:2-amino-4-hydroxy-6-hydroxymethyldihydropteridine diphosphokinase